MHRTSQTRGARFGRSGRWGEVAAQDRHRGWRPSARQLLVGSGFVSLLWFLIRVLPKPSRAAYPCQRAAAPLASAFVVWLLAAMGSWAAWKKARELFRRNRGSLAWVCAAGACVGGLFVLSGWPGESLRADPPVLHGPLGAGRGVHPGRVVWVHGPDSTDWDGYDSPEPWWQTNHTDLAVVEEMMSLALRRLTGEATDAAAWQALFLDFNRSRDGNSRPYRSGEKIAIKINLTTCSARGDEVDPVTYEKKAGVMNRIDNSPQMILALLRQLVFVARVPAGDIAVGDPTGLFPKYMYDFLATEFPEIGYFDNRGGMGRRRTEFSDRPFGWSTAAAQDKLRDFIPVPFAEADYLINFALLKGHQCGVTLCAKNHYGSLLRCPDGYSREAGDIVDYYDFHAGLAGIGGRWGMVTTGRWWI